MQEKPVRRPNADRSAATRARLISAARALFAAKGYAETSTPEIVRAAGVTRGALYHHFRDKAALFEATAAAEAAAVAAAIRSSEPGAAATPEAALLAGAKAYFAAMTAPGRARILLVEGPAALGEARMRAIDAGSVAELEAGLAAAGVAEGAVLAALADVLATAFDRAALAIADGADAGPYEEAFRLLLAAIARA